MASKYASLRGKIPEERREPTEKDLKLAAEMATHVDRSFLNLTALYNQRSNEADTLSEQLEDVNFKLEALERLIKEQLDAAGADSIKMNGFTWSPTCEPFPQAKDPAAIIAYFQEHGMADQLVLKATELASRLRTYVKEEALANELRIESKVAVDPYTGEETTFNEVWSQIPGVKVFLKSSLSRVKSAK